MACYVSFWQIPSYLDPSLSNKHGHQLKVSPQGKIAKHSFTCTSVNTFIFLADAPFENEAEKRTISHIHTRMPRLADVKQAHIQLFDWPVLLLTCDRLCRNYFSREMKSFHMTQVVNLIHHLESLQISLSRERLFSHYIHCKIKLLHG